MRVQGKWRTFKDRIFNKDEEALNTIKRQLLLDMPTNDFHRRLDMIDTYPELFFGDNRKQGLKLTEEEFEQLRILIINQQEKKML